MGGYSVLSVSLQTHGLSAWIICPYLSLSLSVPILGLLKQCSGKNPTANVGDTKYRFDPWVGKIPWRRKWQATSVSLPGKSHGQATPDQSQPSHILCNSPQSSLHPPLYLLHIRFLPPPMDFTLPLYSFLIPSCLRNSLYLLLPHHVFGVSFSEILGNSGFCHSTGFSFLLSLFPAPSSLKGSSQCMVVSPTLKASPPPQDLMLFPTLLLLLVSVMTEMQESSSWAQVFITPVHMAPFLIHTSQLSGYPEV